MRNVTRWATSSILTAAALVLSACSAHMISHHVGTADDAWKKEPVQGLFYTLPQTVIRITLPMTLSEARAGEYLAFADLFFPGEQKLEAGRKLTFKQAAFTTRGVPDPRHVYYLRVEGRRAMEQTLNLSFTEQGAVTGLKTVTANKTADVVLATVGSVASILTKAAAIGRSEESAKKLTTLQETLEWSCASHPTLPPEPGPGDFSADYDEAVERHFVQCFLLAASAGANNQQVRGRLVNNYWRLEDAARKSILDAYRDVADRDKPVLGKDRLALGDALATYLLYAELAVEQNEALKSPEVAMEGYASALDRVEARMKELRGKFLGSKKADQEWTAVFEILPGECDSKRAEPCEEWPTEPASALLEYLPDEGICGYDSAALAGSPPSSKLDVTAAGKPRCLPPHEPSRLKLALHRDPLDDQLVTRVAGSFERPAEAGLHYIVPAQMRAEIQIEPGHCKGDGSAAQDVRDLRSSSAHLMIAQHGIVTAMPSTFGGKAMTHDVTFYDASGAVKSFNLVSTPMIDKGMVDSLSGTANTLLDARIKQQEAEAAAADPLNQLKKEKDTLEALLAIQKACAELENPPEDCGE